MAVEGTKKEKKRTQDIADSLDLGGDLAPEPEDTRTGGEFMGKSKSVPSQQPTRIGGKRMDSLNAIRKLEERRARLEDPSRMPVGKRRSVG